jgi:hypothetical protein
MSDVPRANAGAITGGVIGGLLVLGACVVAVWAFLNRQQRRKMGRKKVQEDGGLVLKACPRVGEWEEVAIEWMPQSAKKDGVAVRSGCVELSVDEPVELEGIAGRLGSRSPLELEGEGIYISNTRGD